MLKKSIFILLLFTVFVFAGENWLSNLEEAKTVAVKENKTIMLYFSGSDWCRPCILLKIKVFETESFKKFAKNNLVLTQFDFPAKDKNKLDPVQIKHNEMVADLYNPNGNFPQVVLITPQGKVIKDFKGYNNESPEYYIAKLKESLAVK